jgi:hypothetical protein
MEYEDAFPNITEPHWSRGIDLDFVPAVPILGIVTLVLGLLRRYEGVTAFGVLGAILTYAMIRLLAAGWLGEPDEPEDVGVGAWLALFAWIVLVASCVVAWRARLKRRSP